MNVESRLLKIFFTYVSKAVGCGTKSKTTTTRTTTKETSAPDDECYRANEIVLTLSELEMRSDAMLCYEDRSFWTWYDTWLWCV